MKPKIYIINRGETLFIPEVETQMFYKFEIVNIFENNIEIDFFLNLFRPKRIIEEQIVMVVANKLNNKYDNALNDVLNNSLVVKKVQELPDSLNIPAFLKLAENQLSDSTSVKTPFDPQKWLGKELIRPVFITVGTRQVKFMNKGESFDFKDLERCKGKDLFTMETHQTSILVLSRKNSIVYKNFVK